MNAKNTELLATLSKLVGAERLSSEAADCERFSHDVFKQAEHPVAAVVRPETVEQLAAAVGAVTAAGQPVIARGGGMSYTGGYLPAEDNSIVVDTRELNKIVEINTTDMYVTVECGCTWQSLHAALKGSGMRPAWWGPLSGIRATVGGSLSQHSIFWGSGHYGISADAVLGLQVVLADGSIVHTGSGAAVGSKPFFRHFGPDLTGIFLGDTGAMGVKAVATLRLVADLPERGFASFDFSDSKSLISAMSEVSRRGLAMESLGFDPDLQAMRMRRASLMEDLKSLGGVAKSAGSPLRAIWDSLRVVLAGRRYMRDVQYSGHFMIEQHSRAAVKHAVAEIGAICRRAGGRQIEASIPRILRANPFAPVNNMIGPDGQRWVPVHGLLPHSKAPELVAELQAIFARHSEQLSSREIVTGFLFATVSTNCFVVEPVFFWPDSLMTLHRESVTPDWLQKVPQLPENKENRALVQRIYGELIAAFRAAGAVHLQIGKTYPYRAGLRPESWRLVEQLKHGVDPERRLNPGALGL